MENYGVLCGPCSCALELKSQAPLVVGILGSAPLQLLAFRSLLGWGSADRSAMRAAVGFRRFRDRHVRISQGAISQVNHPGMA
jgi:hypothetical protein